MAHYAFLDENNIVTQVIVGRNEDEVVAGITDWEAHYEFITGRVCKRTSYNTYRDENGVSQHANGGTPFRGKYAGIGDTYDAVNDVFVSPTTEVAE
jgi:hypothetical protein